MTWHGRQIERLVSGLSSIHCNGSLKAICMWWQVTSEWCHSTNHQFWEQLTFDADGFLLIVDKRRINSLISLLSFMKAKVLLIHERQVIYQLVTVWLEILPIFHKRQKFTSLQNSIYILAIFPPHLESKGLSQKSLQQCFSHDDHERLMTYDKTDGQPGKSALVKEAKCWQHILMFQLSLLHPHFLQRLFFWCVHHLV